jgi:tetratricopeptide (TPR) repeat protein
LTFVLLPGITLFTFQAILWGFPLPSIRNRTRRSRLGPGPTVLAPGRSLRLVTLALAILTSILTFGLPAYATGDVTIKVQAPDGSPFQDSADVLLSNTGGAAGLHQSTGPEGEAHFNGVASGTYYIVVTAQGYLPGHDVVVVASVEGGQYDSWISLIASSEPGNSAAGTVLAPKRQKELAEAVDQLRAGKSVDAEKLLGDLYKAAPGSPEVNYFFGYACLDTGSFADAERYLSAATKLDPKYIDPLVALGKLDLKQNKPDRAATSLQQAITLDPHNYLAHWLLASVYLTQQNYSDARNEAQAAVSDGKGAGNGAEIIIGEAWAADGDYPKAIDALKVFVTDAPGNSAIPQAQKMIADLQTREKLQADSETIRALANSHLQSSASPSAAAPSSSVTAIARAAALADIGSDLPLPKWAPDDVDQTKPAIAADTTCALPQVLSKTGTAVTELVSNVQNIDASEALRYEQLNELGRPVGSDRRSYDYQVSYVILPSGHLYSNEDRNGSTDPLPGGIKISGLSSMALIFHPAIRDDFQMTCEGLGSWHGGKTWIVYFRQRDGKPRRVSEYSIGGNVYPLSLKGRAWIAADTYQIVHIETDLMKPMPEIRLMLQHISVDYSEISFHTKNERAWLPSTANIYFEFRKQRLHVVDTYSHFRMFNVGSSQVIHNPDYAPNDTSPPVPPVE